MNQFYIILALMILIGSMCYSKKKPIEGMCNTGYGKGKNQYSFTLTFVYDGKIKDANRKWMTLYMGGNEFYSGEKSGTHILNGQATNPEALNYENPDNNSFKMTRDCDGTIKVYINNVLFHQLHREHTHIRGSSNGVFERVVFHNNEYGPKNIRDVQKNYNELEAEVIGTWKTGEWGECSKECGGGTKTREVKCVNSTNHNEVVDSNKCTQQMPPTEQECNTIDCYKLEYGDWGECTPSCGVNRVRKRDEICKDFNGHSVDITKCSGLRKEVVTEPCDQIECQYKYDVSEWGECNKDCNGQKTRDVRCVRVQNDKIQESSVDNTKCLDQKPADRTSCNSCTLKYNEWSDCINGERTRTVYCFRDVDKEKLGIDKCSDGNTKPHIREPCSEQSVSPPPPLPPLPPPEQPVPPPPEQPVPPPPEQPVPPPEQPVPLDSLENMVRPYLEYMMIGPRVSIGNSEKKWREQVDMFSGLNIGSQQNQCLGTLNDRDTKCPRIPLMAANEVLGTSFATSQP